MERVEGEPNDRIDLRVRDRRDERGFTLIEMLIVVALIGLVSVFALPSISNVFRLSLNSATREIASMVKETYNSAVITGRVHRMVYDIDSNAFWAEVGPANLLLETEASREIRERREGIIPDEEKKAPPKFQMDPRISRKKVQLPQGVFIDSIVTEQSPEAIVEGTAYTHMFPHGITEQTIIYLADSEEHKISLVISPIVGQTTMYYEHVGPEEIFGK